jgi:hypothetical protein
MHYRARTTPRQNARASWLPWLAVPAVVLSLVVDLPHLARWLVESWSAPPSALRRDANHEGNKTCSSDADALSAHHTPAEVSPSEGCYQDGSRSPVALSPDERRGRLLAALPSLGFDIAFDSASIVVWAPPSARKIEHAYWLQAITDTVRRDTRLALPDRRLIVIRCPRLADSARVTAAAHSNAFPRDAAGAYYRSIDVAFVLDHPTCHVTLCHEVVHWVLAHTIPDCSPALNEGLAQFLSEKVVAPSLQRTADEAYEQLQSPGLRVRLSRSMRREGRLRRWVAQQDRFDLFALCHAGPDAIYGPGPDAKRLRDLSFCLALVLNERSDVTRIQLPDVLRQIQQASHAGDALAALRAEPRFESEWVNTIKTYRAPRFAPQR